MVSKKDVENFEKLLSEADAAGKAAVAKLNVVPMVVAKHVNQMDDSSPIEQSWFVADGVCGFAWINVKPGNSPFANYLKKSVSETDAIGKPHKDDYYGGVKIWVHGWNQSMQKKAAYAHGFAGVLQAHGIKANGESRLD